MLPLSRGPSQLLLRPSNFQLGVRYSRSDLLSRNRFKRRVRLTLTAGRKSEIRVPELRKRTEHQTPTAACSGQNVEAFCRPP